MARHVTLLQADCHSELIRMGSVLFAARLPESFLGRRKDAICGLHHITKVTHSLFISFTSSYHRHTLDRIVEEASFWNSLLLVFVFLAGHFLSLSFLIEHPLLVVPPF